MRTIKHQQQPTSKSCTSTCIAMITGQDATDVMNEFEDMFFETKVRPAEYLRRKGYIVREFSSNERHFLTDMVYLLSVPSLNIQAGLHSVILDTRDGLKIHDPNEGKEGKLYYSMDDEEHENAVAFKSWVIDLEVCNFNEVKRWRKIQ